jgi:hypothetical protein
MSEPWIYSNCAPIKSWQDVLGLLEAAYWVVPEIFTVKPPSRAAEAVTEDASISCQGMREAKTEAGV